MAYITVIGRTVAGNADTFGLTLDTEERRWEVSEPGGTFDVFVTRGGDYIHKVAPERGTYLLGQGGAVVALLVNLELAPAVGDSGRGTQHETGRVFNWTVDSL